MDSTSITTAVKFAFAAVNLLVWTGIFLYLLRLAKRVRNLESANRDEGEGRS